MRQHSDQVSPGDTAANPPKTCIQKIAQVAKLPQQAAECHVTEPIVLRSRIFDRPSCSIFKSGTEVIMSGNHKGALGQCD